MSPSRLIVAPAKQPLHMFAAPLYRMILTAYLDLKLAPRKPVGRLGSYEGFSLSHFEIWGVSAAHRSWTFHDHVHP